MDIRVRVLQVVGEVFSQRLHSCLACIVRRIARWVCDALLATCDDDCARSVGRARLKGGDVCVQAIDYAVEVGVEDLPKIRTVVTQCDRIS